MNHPGAELPPSGAGDDPGVWRVIHNPLFYMILLVGTYFV